MTIIKHYTLSNPHGDDIQCDIRYRQGDEPKPVVVVMHGFKGFKEWGFVPYLCEQLAEAGAIALSFNFSLCGIADPEKMLYNPEIFAKNTISREIADAKLVIDSIDEICSSIGANWNGNIYLFGHSLGGAISFLTAASNQTIGKVATWGAIAKFDRYTRRQKEMWQKQGFMEFEVFTTKQKLRMNVSFLEDIVINADKYSIINNIAKIQIPLLILHGEIDLTVPLAEAKQLRAAAGDSAKLVIIEKAGHIFGIEHPFKEPKKELIRALDETIKFFELK